MTTEMQGQGVFGDQDEFDLPLLERCAADSGESGVAGAGAGVNVQTCGFG